MPCACRERAELQVLRHGQFAENAAAFRHQRDPFLDDVVRLQTGDRPPVHRDIAGLAFHHSRDGLQQRRFAGAVGAKNHANLALGDLQRHALKRAVASVGDG
jgi:hypothetical protein